MGVKKGISIWAFGEMDLKGAFAMAGRAGFEGVEVALDEAGEMGLAFTEKDARRVRDMAGDAGIELFSVATGLYWRYPLTDSDPAVRRKAAEIARKQIEAAAWLGCDTILLVPGTVDAEVPYDIAYDRALEAVGALAGFAGERGVVVGVENVWNKFLLSPLEMRDFIDRAGSPFVKAYFDIGNVVRDGYPEQWVRILGPRIAKVHLKDYRRAAGTLEGFVDPPGGDVDFPAVLGALRAVGYDGWITAEVFPGPGTNIGPWVAGIGAFMDDMLRGG